MKSEITYAELCQIIAEIGEYSYTADIENINLIEAGFESLKVMLISSELKRRGINVRVSELLKKPYLAEWWKIIKMQSVSAESKRKWIGVGRKRWNFLLPMFSMRIGWAEIQIR